jgi:succinoglycan biosynthesis protein ExoA
MNLSCMTPTVSAVVPCRNERDHIKTCVQSLLAQKAPPGGFEVIVADGMSDDGTREILSNIARSDSRLKVIDNPERVTACGMNAGIRHARGQYIAIMGAHNRYAPDYLQSSVEVLQETGADNVGGSMSCLGKSWLQRAIAVAHHSPFAVGGARWHDIHYEGPADTAFGGFYRREVFDRIGLFDETLVRNQDDEFNLRLTRAGGKIWHSPRIKSWYQPRQSLGSLLQQQIQYGYWKVRVIQKHKIPASIRHLVPGCFVLSLIVLALTSPWSRIAFWGWIALAGLYSLCSLVASIVTAWRTEWKLFPLLPLVFACYHFGYGYGFLRGILDFVILKREPTRAYTKLTRDSMSNGYARSTASSQGDQPGSRL